MANWIGDCRWAPGCRFGIQHFDVARGMRFYSRPLAQAFPSPIQCAFHHGGHTEYLDVPFMVSLPVLSSAQLVRFRDAEDVVAFFVAVHQKLGALKAEPWIVGLYGRLVAGAP